MRSLEIARTLAQLNQTEKACRAYTLALHENGGADPGVELEAAMYILQFGSGDNYKISYTVFHDLYNRDFCKEDILQVMDGAFYAPNLKLMQTRYRKNCALLEKYPYMFRKDFPKFENLPIRFYPYDDNSFTPYYVREQRFGDYIDLREPVIKHHFFKDLENPILAQDVYSQYELEYLRDNVRRSEDVARENHIYLHYSSWAEFCAYLVCLNIKPLLEEKKIVFLFEDEIGQYPIDFKKRFNIDYSKYTVKPLALREVTKIVWHTQLNSHNGGDFFNEIFDAHPNLIAMPSILMSSIDEKIAEIQDVLDRCESLAQAQESFKGWEVPHLIEELYHNRARTGKDILAAMYLYRKEYSQFVDKNSRIAPALFFQPHFTNIVTSLEIDSKGRTMLRCKEHDNLLTSMAFQGFKYIKTFTPMRRPTTSHAASVRFMVGTARAENQSRMEDKDKKITVVTDEVSTRVLNRTFMIDPEDKLYQDSVLVRFEDGKLNPKATFTALAAFLDLPYTESMSKCTISGEETFIPGNVAGFDPASVYRTYDDFVNDKERIFLEYFLRDAYEYYGYSFHYYDGKPLSIEEMKEIVQGFDMMDKYIEETWKLVYKTANISLGDEPVSEDVQELVRGQLLEDYMKGVRDNRITIVETLTNNLRFVNKNGQPLHMMPKLELDPALLEQPLYH